MVIGHTHRARITVQLQDVGNPLVLIDCSAWIADPKPNVQIAVPSANEAYIYHLPVVARLNCPLHANDSGIPRPATANWQSRVLRIGVSHLAC